MSDSWVLNSNYISFSINSLVDYRGISEENLKGLTYITPLNDKNNQKFEAMFKKIAKSSNQ